MPRLKPLLATALATSALLIAPAQAQAQSTPVRFTLPAPPAEVGTTELHLTDKTRKDPWHPERTRELMISLWYPTKDTTTEPAPWVRPGVTPVLNAFGAQIGLPPNSVAWDQIKSHGRQSAPVDRAQRQRPVILYSPGFGGPRGVGTILVEQLAAAGYIVATIDHTYETAVEFPQGRVEQPIQADPTPENMKTYLDARVADTRLVLDKLALLNRGVNPDEEQRPLPRNLTGSMDLDRVGMFGHSYGGFTAGETMHQDRRIDAGINMDGAMAYSAGQNGTPYLPGEVVKHGATGPFLLMGSQFIDDSGNQVDHTHRDPYDRSWGDFWRNQCDWKLDLLLRTSSHYSYSDLQAIIPQLAGPLNMPAQTVAALIGTIDPARSVATQRAYTTAFFDRFLRGRPSALLHGPSPAHPEIDFIR